MKHGMGWIAPKDRSHERRYSMDSFTIAAATPVVIGCNWYDAFDAPEKRADGFWWIGINQNWGSVRGGHAVCLRPPALTDLVSAWDHYNQGEEGACSGFASARAASIYNRRLYDGFNQYYAARRNDQWIGENYEGSSINGALQGLRLEGAWRVRSGVPAATPTLADGISRFVWANSVDQIRSALKTREQFVRVLNSWGRDYPREVRLPLYALERLISEGGEFGVPIDR